MAVRPLRTLHLVSPHSKNPDVTKLQRALKKAGYLPGTPDNEYGPVAAQAVYRAKLRLGYPKPDKVGDQRLLDYLTGKRKPGPVMKALALKRAAVTKVKVVKREKAHGPLTHGQVLVKLALTQLGETEHPAGSNRSKYNAWYGVVGAWCAMFVTWLHVTGNVGHSFKKGVRYAYVPYIAGDAVAGRNGLMVAPGPASGIVCCFDWPGESPGTADHTGIAAAEADLREFAPHLLDAAIKEFGKLRKNEFWTIEGNTAVGNDSNGGIVMIRKRSRSLVQRFVKVAA